MCGNISCLQRSSSIFLNTNKGVKSNFTNPVEAVLAGLEMQRFISERYEEKGENYWQCRLGINTGPVVAGVIGRKRLAYDIWGDAVNVASRMQTKGVVGKVHISESTYQDIKDFFECEERGLIDIKGKGNIYSYFVNQISPDLSHNHEGIAPNDKFWDLVKKKSELCNPLTVLSRNSVES